MILETLLNSKDFHFTTEFQGELFLELPKVARTYDLEVNSARIPVYKSEFWTSKQRQANSIHEISYRACFKPQLPSFFIKLLTDPGSKVYDPFSGRGTTCLEAGLLGRRVAANDINPLSQILISPRFFPPDETELSERLSKIKLDPNSRSDLDLSMFYHPKTLSEVLSLRAYLFERRINGQEDPLDSWIRMVATNRLTGHSNGFFSVYTLPPNQAVSAESQIKINQRLKQVPVYRNIKEIIRRKTGSLLRTISALDRENLVKTGASVQFMCSEADDTKELESCSVDLTVTSPPFLDVVQYAQDNWLRCWFNHIDHERISKQITTAKTVDQWRAKMKAVFQELYRVTKTGGWVAFEVGEIRKNTIRLEEIIAPVGMSIGFECNGIIINSQEFTKTANIWGVNNNKAGTNTNRIVLFRKTV
ncbi:MAG: DNA methyltransferase [Deltaproteobacteria bacterium]|nr:DNA methyltransferase [Deltaproteobacteria bacterium]